MADLSVPLNDQDHVIGPRLAKLNLVEYGDFECPFCGEAYSIVKDILKLYEGRLLFAYRHFPLAEIHPHAEDAAESSEAASEAGKFWQMHDMLFEHQGALDEFSLIRYASALDLDVEDFAASLRLRVYKPKVDDDFTSGVKSGVAGTPTFFINGRRHQGSYLYKELLRALRRAEALL
jgi:protein-disulfide isomerase